MEIGKSYLIDKIMHSVWCIKPFYLNNIISVIEKKINDPKFYVQLYEERESKREQPSYVQILPSRKTAILNIEGTLIPKCSFIDSLCGMVSTIKLIDEFEILEKNDSIEKIILYIDSPGGTVTGIGELAEIINNSKKEVIAYTDNVAASGAYLIFAAAKKSYALPSAEIGSIGAYITIIKEKTNAEMEYIIIGEEEGKLFGHPNVPITDDERTYFKNSVHEVYEWFNAKISNFRKVDLEVVKATKSLSYQAISAPEWMIDGFMTASGLNLT